MLIDPPPLFGALLRHHRTTLGLNQTEFAQHVYVSRSQIKEIERSRTRPSPLVAERIADYLHLTDEGRTAFLASARAPLPDPILAGAAPPAGAGSAGSRLPQYPTALLGRDSAVAAMVRMLERPEVRILTVTGPPGVGKTRLALAATSALRPRYPAGVFFVPLETIQNPDQVLATIMRTVPGTTEGVTSADQLGIVLGSGRSLLVLDNFEQLLAAGTTLAALLARIPTLQILVTSREVLHLYGEHEYPVPPLAVPEARAGLPFDALADYAAVVLFVQRAQAVQPDFVLTDANAAAVAALCAHLDGLPLAIELAAARSKLFSPAALLARMGNCLALLTGGPRDRPARQQTLRGAIAWSYDLLTPAEQAFFDHMALFPDGCTEADMLATYASADADADSLALMLGTLLDKNLLYVISEEVGVPRVGMLQSIRAYAWEQLMTPRAAGTDSSLRSLTGAALPDPLVPLCDGTGAGGSNRRRAARPPHVQ